MESITTTFNSLVGYIFRQNSLSNVSSPPKPKLKYLNSHRNIRNNKSNTTSLNSLSNLKSNSNIQHIQNHTDSIQSSAIIYADARTSNGNSQSQSHSNNDSDAKSETDNDNANDLDDAGGFDIYEDSSRTTMMNSPDGAQITYSAFDKVGQLRKGEDVVLICTQPIVLFGIFDGHRNRKAAEFCERNMPLMLQKLTAKYNKERFKHYLKSKEYLDSLSDVKNSGSVAAADKRRENRKRNSGLKRMNKGKKDLAKLFDFIKEGLDESEQEKIALAMSNRIKRNSETEIETVSDYDPTKESLLLINAKSKIDESGKNLTRSGKLSEFESDPYKFVPRVPSHEEAAKILNKLFSDCHEAARNKVDEGGCTAAVLFMYILSSENSKKNSANEESNITTKVYVRSANAGDARCVLCTSEGKAERLSFDHKATVWSEVERVNAVGGLVICGNLEGALAITRGIGDHDFEPGFIPTPHISEPFEIVLSSNENDNVGMFAIIASDGIWDCVSDEKAVKVVSKEAAANGFKNAAKVLGKYADKHGAFDDTSCVVISLKPFVQQTE